MGPRFQCYHKDGQVWWRFLGANNRSISRSIHGFADLKGAIADARDVAGLAPEANVEFVSEMGTAWRWVLVMGGNPRATSTSSYGRRLECVRAAARFRRDAPTALVSGTPLVTPPRLAAAPPPRVNRLHGDPQPGSHDRH